MMARRGHRGLDTSNTKEQFYSSKRNTCHARIVCALARGKDAHAYSQYIYTCVQVASLASATANLLAQAVLRSSAILRQQTKVEVQICACCACTEAHEMLTALRLCILTCFTQSILSMILRAKNVGSISDLVTCHTFVQLDWDSEYSQTQKISVSTTMSNQESGLYNGSLIFGLFQQCNA